MKKWFVALLALATMAMAGLAIAAVEKGKITLKVGDEVNVCGCAEGCPCDTISRMEGNCTCGKPLVKGKVTKVEEGTAMIEVNGKERPFKTVGKYQCMCGKECKCDTISQKPGKCGCGMEMQEVK
jgi:hypothetical protein